MTMIISKPMLLIILSLLLVVDVVVAVLLLFCDRKIGGRGQRNVKAPHY